MKPVELKSAIRGSIRVVKEAMENGNYETPVLWWEAHCYLRSCGIHLERGTKMYETLDLILDKAYRSYVFREPITLDGKL